MTDLTALSRRLDPRRFLAAGTALGAAAMLPRGAQAQASELVVSNWGGDWNDRIV